MKKLLAFAILALSIFPSFSLAAYNDLTLTTSAVIKVGSYTLNVTGSSAVLQSIVVNPTNFTVTLGSGSTIVVTSPTLNQLTTDTTTNLVTNTCNGYGSSLSLAYNGPSTGTVTVTPIATTCSNVTTGGGASSGGGGGGGGGTVSPQQLVSILAPSASTTAYLVARNIITLTFTGPLALGSTNTDVTLLQTLLASLGFLHAPPTGYFGPLTEQAVKDYQASRHITVAGFVGPMTRAALNAEKVPFPTASSTPVNATPSVATPQVSSFTRDLTVGSTGSDVTALQQYLNAHGFVIATTGPGSPGAETASFGALTQAALIRFQIAKGISPSVGYFGALTRSYIASHK